MRIILSLLKRAGIDFHVALTLAQRSAMTIAGAVMIYFITHFLTRVEQGYYYTFSSLIALQIFFEMGLNYVVVQLVGHESAQLDIHAAEMDGPPAILARVASLARLLHRWYRVIAVLYFLGVGLAGSVFFAFHSGLPWRYWSGVWLLMVAFSAFNLYYSPRLAFLEGLGRIGQVARLRLACTLVGYCLMWIALVGGSGLWAVPLLPLAYVFGTFLWLRFHGRIFSFFLRKQMDDNVGIHWRTEIFPFQWRIAVSWISGYFIFQLFTPMLFAHQGAVVAGRMGLSINIFTSLQMLGMGWTAARAPAFARLIAQQNYAILNSLFRKVLLSTTVFISSGCVVLLAGVLIIDRHGWEFAGRLSDFRTMCCLALVTVANNLIYAAATFMRANKEEPMLRNSVVTAALMLVGIYFASRYGAFETMLTYMAVTFFVALPWTAILFYRYYRTA